MKTPPYVGGFFSRTDHDRFLTGSAEFDRWFPPRSGTRRTRTFFETGIDALAAIVHEAGAARLWVPSNFCGDSLARLVGKCPHGLELQPYDDVDRAAPESGDLFLFLHFNRYDDSVGPIAAALEKRNVVVIEDFAHAPAAMAQLRGSYGFTSLRKLSSMDVAVAYLREPALVATTPSAYRIAKKAAEDEKSAFQRDGDASRESRYLNGNQEAEAALHVPTLQGAAPEEIARAVAFDFGAVLAVRRRNYEALAAELLGTPGLEILPGESMYLMVRTSRRDALRAHLMAHGIFPAIHWADAISAEPQRLLSLPVDQRYDEATMRRVARAVREIS